MTNQKSPTPWKSSWIKWKSTPGRKKGGTNAKPRKIRWAIYLEEAEFHKIISESKELEIRPIFYLQEHIRRRKVFFNQMCDVYWSKRKERDKQIEDKNILETPIDDLIEKQKETTQ